MYPPEPEDHGIWLIYGAEKNGKTTFALMLTIICGKWEEYYT